MGVGRGRRRFRAIAVFAACAAVWIGIARWVVPPMIVATAQGRSLPALRGLITDTSEPAVKRLVDQWRELSPAILIAVAFQAAIVALVRRYDERMAHDTDRARRPLHVRLTNLALCWLSVAFLAATVVLGCAQDYTLYLAMWSGIREGRDPWVLVFGVFGNYPLNAYGPLFNLLAGLAWVNPLAPKLLFAWSYLMFSVWQVKRAARTKQFGGWFIPVLLVWFFNPFAWIELALFGHFDILVGLACVAAVRARTQNRDASAGAWLAVGVLLKYIPLVVLPFLSIEGRRFRWRVILTALALILLGLGVSYLIWGPSTFRPILFAAVRPSSRLSIVKFLEGRYSPIPQDAVLFHVENFRALMVLVMILALTRAWSWCRTQSVDPAAGSVLGVLITLLLYRVGFPQYQMVLFVLLSDWVLSNINYLRGAWLLIFASFCYFGWLSYFDILDCVIELGYTRIEDMIGLPTFVVGCLLAASVVYSAKPRPHPTEATPV